MMSCDKTYFVEIGVDFVMDNLESSNHKCQIWSKSWKRNKDNKKKLKYYMNISSSNSTYIYWYFPEISLKVSMQYRKNVYTKLKMNLN